jgi:protein-L-isoaspartate O-methyltransferase
MSKLKNRDRKEDNSKHFVYSVIDIFRIKSAKYFWYYVDKFSCKLERFANLYEKILRKVYKKEGEEFGINNVKNILHVGCGAYPVSALTLAELNGGNIVGIDSNPKVIKPAIEVIKKKNLEDRVKIKHGNGTNYPLDKFDMIIVSGCAAPKKNVVKHIFQTAKPGTKIIVRELYSSKRVFDDMLKNYKDIEILKRIENKPFITSKWESFYLEKK